MELFLVIFLGFIEIWFLNIWVFYYIRLSVLVLGDMKMVEE